MNLIHRSWERNFRKFLRNFFHNITDIKEQKGIPESLPTALELRKVIKETGIRTPNLIQRVPTG